MFVMIPERPGLTIATRAAFSRGGIQGAHGSRRRWIGRGALQRIHSRSSPAQPRLAQCVAQAAIHAAFPDGDLAMFARKLALIPAALFALGLIVAAPAESFAQQSGNKPAAAPKKDAAKKKDATKKKDGAKKKAPAAKKPA